VLPCTSAILGAVRYYRTGGSTVIPMLGAARLAAGSRNPGAPRPPPYRPQYGAQPCPARLRPYWGQYGKTNTGPSMPEIPGGRPRYTGPSTVLPYCPQYGITHTGPSTAEAPSPDASASALPPVWRRGAGAQLCSRASPGLRGVRTVRAWGRRRFPPGRRHAYLSPGVCAWVYLGGCFEGCGFQAPGRPAQGSGWEGWEGGRRRVQARRGRRATKPRPPPSAPRRRARGARGEAGRA
jgi:hypothetical protein